MILNFIKHETLTYFIAAPELGVSSLQMIKDFSEKDILSFEDNGEDIFKTHLGEILFTFPAEFLFPFSLIEERIKDVLE